MKTETGWHLDDSFPPIYGRVSVTPPPRPVIIQKAAIPLDPEDIAPKGEYYHGSPHADNIIKEGFQSRHLGSGNDQWSPGYYFTNNKTLARGYTEPKYGEAPTGAGVVRVGLNIKKPIKLNSEKHNNVDDWPNLSPAHTQALIHHATQSMTGEDDLSDWGDVSYEGRPKVLKTMVGMYSGGSPASLLYDVYGKDRLEEGLRKYSSLTGHDGVEVSYPTGEKHTVAWFPEQIKVQGKL